MDRARCAAICQCWKRLPPVVSSHSSHRVEACPQVGGDAEAFSNAGAGSGGAKSLLLGLAGNGSAAAGATAMDDSIVFGIFGHNSRIRQVKAGRAWRKVMLAVGRTITYTQRVAFEPAALAPCNAAAVQRNDVTSAIVLRWTASPLRSCRA